MSFINREVYRSEIERQAIANNEQFFTLYWLNGTKNVITGKSIEHAFSKYYSAGALTAIDFYNEGVTNTHHWNGKEWVKRDDFLFDVGTNKPSDISEKEMKNLLETYSSVIFVLANGDQIVIKIDIGDYACIGLVNVGNVFYAEKQEGSYFDDESDGSGCHYMVCNSTYHEPDQIADMIETADALFNGNHGTKGKSLEEIKKNQKFFC